MAKTTKSKKASSDGWKFSITDSLSYGFEKTKKFFWITLGLWVLLYIFTWALGFVIASAVPYFGDAKGLWLFVMWFVQMYVTIMIGLGWIKLFLAVLAGKSPALAYFIDTENHRYFWSYILTELLCVLIVFVGCILLIIPGIIWLYTYCLAPVLVVDKNLRADKALALSRKLVAGQRLNLFVWTLVICGINLLVAICLGIGLLLTIPISYYASLYVYGKLAGKPIK